MWSSLAGLRLGPTSSRPSLGDIPRVVVRWDHASRWPMIRWLFGLGFGGLLWMAVGCIAPRHGSMPIGGATAPEGNAAATVFDDGDAVLPAPSTTDGAQSKELSASCEFQRVVVDRQGGVLLDGAAAGKTSWVGPPALASGLWQRLGSCFLQVHEGIGTAPHAVEVPENATLLQTVGVFSTLAHAGYQSLHVQSGPDQLAFRTSVLSGPLGGGASVPVPADRASVPVVRREQSPFSMQRPKRLLLVRLEGQQFELVWADQLTKQSTAKHLYLPLSTPAGELRQRLAKECADPKVTCKRVVVEAAPDTPLSSIFALGNALPSGTQAPLLEFAFLDQSVTGRMKAADLLGNQVDTGTIDQARVLTQINAQLPKVTTCYRRALTRIPKLRGRLVLRFQIEPDGSLTDVMDARTGALPTGAILGRADTELESTDVRSGGVAPAAASILQDDELATCVRDIFTPLTLPKPEAGPVLVIYPFTLEPG